MSDIKTIELLLLPEIAQSSEKLEEFLRNNVSMKLSDWRIKKRSIDARSKQVKYQLQIEYLSDGTMFETEIFETKLPPLKKENEKVIIVGFGPAGMFAALELLKLGIKPIVIERGKAVRERRRDLANMTKLGEVNPESNYCYGEGGAGTYSDGKLYTRSGKRGTVEEVLKTFVEHGAHSDILVDARPHIGTNKLPGIVEAMRESIIKAGGEIRFNSKLTDIIYNEKGICEVEINSSETLPCKHLLLATGHSARDIYVLLEKKRILITPKPFALGVRIEHPQELVDKMQYHCDVRSEYLPPAYYSIVTQANGRGVFSFCMCPGGIIAPAATSPGEIVVNGWSPSKRNGKFANSGMVVSVDETDWKGFESEGNLAAMAFQSDVEKKAFTHGGGKLVAPAQRMMDFVNNVQSSSLPECSYIPGIKSADLTQILPQSVSQALRTGLKDFAKKMKYYGTNEAVLLATESRTSSPVKIPRDKDSLMHPQIEGLYPCGEGAGYAGGIVSAAMDGIKCARAIAGKIMD